MDLRGKIINYKYKIADKIHESRYSNIYIAYNRLENNNKVAIKFLKQGAITNRKEDIIRFRIEAEGVSRIDHPNIIKIREIGYVEDMHYMVMEAITGQSLSSLIESQAVLSIEDSIGIITQLCEALSIIHGQGIVHKSINPDNIMLLSGTDPPGIKIINFAIAQIKDFSRITERDDIIATFSYMAPEQSGMLNRKVDNRSDLYSLGIVLYQLLTGQLPFGGDDISSIIHHHIAMLPESPADYNNAIPEVLGKIVLKLIEKEPDRRYQNAGNVLNDLKRFLSGERDFLIGAEEPVTIIGSSKELVGREQEYEALIRMFDETLRGRGGVCLIYGEQGIGKTRLIEELVNGIYYHQGTFIGVSAIEGENKVPYGTIRDALNRYLKFFNDYPEAKKETVISVLKDEIGYLGEILIKLEPAMSDIFGVPPPLVQLSPEREQKRFLMTISRFFYSLSVVENGIVLILDNLQWIDDSSFAFLLEVIKHIENYPLLVIAVFREDDVLKSQGLIDLIESLKISRYPYREIELRPLDKISMNRYVASLMQVSMTSAEELSELIMNYSRGNPYYAIEILKQLIDEKAIVVQDHSVTIRQDIIQRITILNTAVDIILRRVSLLNEKEIAVLSYAAIMGVIFEIELLLRMTKYPDEDVIAIIDRGIELQLIQKDVRERGRFMFTHRRIRELLYQDIPIAKRKALHLTVARIIEESSAGDIDSVVFEIAHHYIEADEKDKILEYAYPAGIKAKENYANEDAIKYLDIVRGMLEESGRKGQAQWVECMQHVGQILLTIGKFDEAIEVYLTLLKYETGKINKAGINRQISQAYFSKGNWPECERYAQRGLSLLGENLPLRKIMVITGLVKEIIAYYLHYVTRLRRPGRIRSAAREKYKVIINQYMTLSWMYILSDINKFIHSVLRMINISRSKIGTSKELGMSIAVFASLLMVVPLFRKAVRYHEIALVMRQDIKDQLGIAQSMQFMGYAYCYQGEYDMSINYFMQSKDIFTRIGDVWEIAMVNNGLGYDYYYIGQYDDMIACFRNYLDSSEKINDHYGISVSCANLSMAYTLKGDLEKAEQYGMRALSLSKSRELWYPHCFASINYGYLMMEKGDYDEAVNYFDIALRLFLENNFLRDYTVHVFPYLADAYLEIYKIDRSRLTKTRIRKLCAESIRRTRKWPNHFAEALRVNGRYCFLTGDHKKAERYYRRSIRHSAMLGRKFEIAKGLYDYGTMLKETGRIDQSEARLKAAYEIFREIDATLYMQRTKILLDMPQEENLSSIKAIIDRQRMYSIIRVSQDISSIMKLDELLEKVMSVAIEVTGAQRGYLLISNDETGRLEVVSWKNVNVLDQSETIEFVTAIAGDVYRTGEALLTMNAMEDENYSRYPIVSKYGLKSILCIPLKYKDETKGVCYLDNPLSGSVFKNEDKDLLNILMTQAAISIENVRLYELGITDGLTKLITHTHFHNLLQKEINKAIRYSRQISIVMIDIDLFKNFNDTYGHQAGDEVLRSVSRIIKNNCRDVDIAARYGGEELVMVLPETDTVEAEVVAERVRSIIEGRSFEYQGNRLSVTISVGVATFPGDAADRVSLIKAADEALYASKRNGRNRVTVFSQRGYHASA